jgi:tetratricopeptide (TPR) repeat protein
MQETSDVPPADGAELESIFAMLLDQAEHLRGDPGGSGSLQLHAINKLREALPQLAEGYSRAVAARQVELLERLTQPLWICLDVTAHFKLKLELARLLLEVAQESDNRHLLALARLGIGSSLWRTENLSEAWNELALAAEHASELEDPSLRARILRTQAHCRLVADEARPLLDESIQLASDARDDSELAHGLIQLGVLEFELGRYPVARKHLTRSSELMRRLGNLAGESRCLNNLAMLELRAGRAETARMLFLQALEIKQQLGDLRGQASTLANLGCVASELHELETSKDYFQQARELAEGIGDRGIQSVALTNLGMLAHEQHDYVLAATLLSVALEHQRALGNILTQAVTLRFMALLSMLQGDVSEAAVYLEEALRLNQNCAAEREMALSAGFVGILLARQGDYGRGRALILAALEHNQLCGFNFEADARVLLEQSFQELTQSTTQKGRRAEQGGYLSLDLNSLSIVELARYAHQTLRERFMYTLSSEVPK